MVFVYSSFVILFQYFVLETTDPQNLWLSIAINVVYYCSRFCSVLLLNVDALRTKVSEIEILGKNED